MRSAAARALALLLPTLLLLGGAELALRRKLAHEWPWGITRDDAELGWSLNPGWSGRFHGVEVRVSDAGLRDPRQLAALRAAAGATLVLGDSVVMGYGVEEADSVPRLLEQLLRAPAINAGVIGYGTEQEAALLGRLDPWIQPARIVVGTCLNDIASQDQYRVRRVSRDGAARLSESLRERSALFHGMRKRIRKLLVHASRLPEERTGDLDLDVLTRRIDAAPEETLADVRRGLAALGRGAAGRPLLVAIFPYRQQLSGEGVARPQEALLGAAREAGLPALDLLPVFRQAGGELHLDNCHLNAAGAAVAARAIRDRLLDLPAPRAASETP